MPTIRMLLIINTVALLPIILALTGILNPQNEAAAYDPHEAPPVT